MNTETIVQKIADEHGLRRRGKLYAGPCPFCGGSSKSDKFNIRPDGGYICRGCGETGDIITWLRKKEGLSCPDAHDRAGRTCKVSATCSAGKCRYKADKGSAQQAPRVKNRMQAMPYQHKPAEVRPVPTVIPEHPTSKWLAWAEPFAAKCHGLLLQSDVEMQYLAGRGIDRQAVERCGLGLVPHQYQVPKESIGLAIEQDGKLNLWVPEGLLIQIYDQGGALHRLRVRRPLVAMEKYAPELKYVWLKGSGNLPMVIYPAGRCRGAVIVEAELDAIAIAAAHADVLVIAVGTMHGGIGADLHQTLAQIPVILVSLDAETKAKPAVDAWRRCYRHAKYWPTPQAKDAGDYFKRGGDLRSWIESALPPVPMSFQDGAFSPARKQNGGKGAQKKISADTEKPQGPECVEMTLTNGKIIYLVEQKNEVWDRLTSEGLPVFTRHELEKLKEATATMDPEQRIKAAMAAVDAKKVFGGYINRGENNAKWRPGPLNKGE